MMAPHEQHKKPAREGGLRPEGVRDILVGFVAVTGEAVNVNFLASSLVTTAREHPRLDVAIVNGALVATAL